MFAKADRNGARSGADRSMPSIIAADMRIVGQVTAQGDVQLDGTVEGDVRAEHLTVGASGVITGEITAESAQVSGTVTGRIRAKTVTLTRTARVKGDIAHESLSIEAGARFEGQVARLDTAKTANGGIRATPASDVDIPAIVPVPKTA
jgi:cytoskeletal protein CcmA (bactofilin family)